MTAMLTSVICSAQKQDTTKRKSSTHLSLTSLNALNDIASHQIRIFGVGGIASTAYGKEDSLFETKHNVRYVLYGCQPEYMFDQMKEYNLEVGQYLDKRYGKQWRKELHLDVIALKE